MSQPLVSVIIPAYQAERTIGETLASVRHQSVARWEALVADDGSSDGTAAVVERAAQQDERIRLVRLAANSGLPARARNAALEHARGHWIAFLDADDLWESDKLARQLHRLRHTRARWAFSNSVFFGGGAAHPDGLKYSRSWRPPKPFFPALLTGEGVPVLSLIAERALLEEIAPRHNLARLFDCNPELKSVEDWDLMLRLALVAEPDYCPRPLVRYRAHAGGISRQADAAYRARLALIAKYRQIGADGELCRQAEDLQRSKYAVELLFAGRSGWRGLLAGACLAPPVSGRDAFLAALTALPAPLARALYRQALTLRRRP